MSNFVDKIKHSKELIKEAAEKYPKIASGCSFGKDSMVVAHLVKQTAPCIPFFYAKQLHAPQVSPVLVRTDSVSLQSKMMVSGNRRLHI